MNLLGLLSQVRSNETLAFAIIGQALLDEGSILTNKIEVFYNDKRTAMYLFEVANSLILTHAFRTKLALKQRKYGFTIKYAGWARLYKVVGPLPDARKDLTFRFLLRAHPSGPMRVVGESKKRILEFLNEKPRTLRELCYAVGLSGATMSRHLNELAQEGKVQVVGRNIGSRSGKNKAAFLWSQVHPSEASSTHKCGASHPRAGRGSRVV